MPLSQNTTTTATQQEDVVDLMAAIDALGTTLASIDSRLATIVTKLAGGLPSALSSDKLKVTGLL